MGVSYKPRVGVMAIGCQAYWPQFPGMKNHLVKKHEELLDKIRDSAEIFAAGMVDTVELSAAAGRRFLEADVDVVLVQAMTYSPSSNMVPAVRELKVPVILLNVQEEEALDFPNVTKLEDWLGHGCTCAGIAELSAMLIR